MKNKIYLIIIIITFICKQLFAQPILSNIELSPSIGDNYLVHYCDSMNEGTSGANQNWNFANSFCSTQFGLKHVSSVGSSLPSASIVQVVDIDSGFFHNNVLSTNLVANSDATTGFVTLIDSLKQIEYPITFGTNFTDSFRYNPYLISSTLHYKSGKISILCDGYGSITLPSGTYFDVLRLRSIVTTKDSSLGILNFDSTVNFSWLKANNHFAIAWVSKRYVNNLPIPYPSNFYFIDNIATNVIEANEKFKCKIVIYPNPADYYVTVEFSESKEMSKFQILDCLGRPISFDIRKLSKSKYILTPTYKKAGFFILKITDLEGNLIYNKIQFK